MHAFPHLLCVCCPCLFARLGSTGKTDACVVLLRCRWWCLCERQLPRHLLLPCRPRLCTACSECWSCWPACTTTANGTCAMVHTQASSIFWPAGALYRTACMERGGGACAMSFGHALQPVMVVSVGRRVLSARHPHAGDQASRCKLDRWYAIATNHGACSLWYGLQN